MEGWTGLDIVAQEIVYDTLQNLIEMLSEAEGASGH